MCVCVCNTYCLLYTFSVCVLNISHGEDSTNKKCIDFFKGCVTDYNRPHCQVISVNVKNIIIFMWTEYFLILFFLSLKGKWSLLDSFFQDFNMTWNHIFQCTICTQFGNKKQLFYLDSGMSTSYERTAREPGSSTHLLFLRCRIFI